MKRCFIMFALLIFTLFLAVLSESSDEVIQEDIVAVGEMVPERLNPQQEALEDIVKE